MSQADHTRLFKWYKNNHRVLPWRHQKKTPYTIWISEIMLQQTTVKAVIPYYQRFLKHFKNLESLATAPLEDVLEVWSGLGYYSRAKNLHKAAQIIHKKKYFPQSYTELIQLPGFGPYTARAVSSLAFEEKVGVLDANVIRVLCRFLNLKCQWWKTEAKNTLQEEVDKWVKHFQAGIMNQALMELGSLVCTTHNPTCLICPLNKNCKALKNHQVHHLPLKRKQQTKQIWFWKPSVFIKNKPSKSLSPTMTRNRQKQIHYLRKSSQIAFIKNNTLPVLKREFIFPGEIKRRQSLPKSYDFIHYITHHSIYVQVSPLLEVSQKTSGSKNINSSQLHLIPLSLKKSTAKTLKKSTLCSYSWFKLEDIKKINPSSLIQKVLNTAQKKYQ